MISPTSVMGTDARFLALRCLLIAGLATVGLNACSRKNEEILPVLNPKQENAAYVRFLKNYDIDRDGEITCADGALKRSKTFAELDKDSNGELDAGEYRFAKFQDRAFLYIELSDVDTDQSLTISEPEFTGVPNSEYLALDGDGNCSVSREEIIAAARVEMEKRLLRGEGLGRRGHPGDDGRDDAPGVEEIDPVEPEEKEKPVKKKPPLTA